MNRLVMLVLLSLTAIASPGWVFAQETTQTPAVVGDDDVIVDRFAGSMLKQWHWRRENRDGWKLTDAGLQVLVEPGNMWGNSNDAKNVLLHPIPDRWQDRVDVIVQLQHHPVKRWEQANLVWYYSDSTMVKLGLEIENGETNIVMGREQDDRTKTIAIVPYPEHFVELQLSVRKLDISGYYRRPGQSDWQLAGQTSLPESSTVPPPQASLQFYQGEVGSDRWATVQRFEMHRP